MSGKKRAWGEVQIEFNVEVLVPANASLEECEAAIDEEAREQAGNLSADITFARLTDVEDGIQDVECMECGEPATRLHHDPRDPPLDTEPCICPDCRRTALEDMRDEIEAELDDE